MMNAFSIGIDALTLLKEEAKINPGSPSSFLPRWGDELFPRNPRETLLEGGFPFTELFIGNSGNEGVCAITSAIPEVFGFFGEKDALIGREAAVTYLRSFFPTFKDQDQVIEQYLHLLNEAEEPEVASKQYILALGDALGDFIIECPTVYYAAVSSQSGVNVYYYDFQHRPVNSVWADWMGTTHFDEVDFVFGGPFKFPSDYPTEERVLSKIMIEHWTNFVKYGKPKDDWPLYVNKSEILVYIDAKQPSEARGPHMYNCMFFQPYMDSENKIVLPDYSLQLSTQS
ncbi:Acetylcholinesterase-1 [Araneus ventricosus]|uniref:Acetylcholinesterase-1 n=1 Tax=Araneus ventricosus TaxID=182803 RepID=A0A4Y2GAT6_ARAVE|nr:Acetylcholinesterase-1 [Araneus ventricosus]